MATAKTQTQSTQTEWIDEMTYQAGVHIEKGKQRSNTLRGERAKTRTTQVWADKQEVKTERQETQLKTEQTKLQTDKEKLAIAQTNLKGTQAAGVLNEIGWRQRLVKKSYAVGINPCSMAKAIAPTTAEVIDLVGTVTSKTKVKEEVK
ncbi:hypothetical protein LC653_28860 [Nostoc sp. CHAB 5784]|uniref:hypothetical protein n=1 Tax=Nostoc mirabile TaxID=2907820 RepID=UPI001E35B964|nr:hypothetical protein [Nostoc mirabile]MCC5667781.1 hypothetical protein [Nostoc mirabile CHAB5784]